MEVAIDPESISASKSCCVFSQPLFEFKESLRWQLTKREETLGMIRVVILHKKLLTVQENDTLEAPPNKLWTEQCQMLRATPS